MKKLLVLICLTALLTARAMTPDADATKLKAAGDSGQIITVTVKKESDHSALVNVYEKLGELWYKKYGDIPAVVGSRGIMENRKQNTYKSPAGNYGFVSAFGAKENPGVKYDYRVITQDSYWVTDRESALYNRWTEGKSGFKYAERLVEYGYQYDYAMVIDFNYENPVKGDGAAIFLHVATKDGRGTAGCVALEEETLKAIMLWLDPEKNPRIIICAEKDLVNY